MPVSDCHALYIYRRPQWDRIQDLLEGEDRIREKGTTYLPKIYKASAEEYDAYSKRASLFNATKRTAEAMAGFIFRKPPQIKTSLGKRITEDIDMKGTTLPTYCRKVTNAVCSKGRAGTLVDWNEEEQRPYFSFFIAEDIINWNVTRIKGRMALSLLVLRQPITAPAVDGFTIEAKDQWLVFRLTEQGVTREIWEGTNPVDPTDNAIKPDSGSKVVTPAEVLTRRDESLKEIPFEFHNADEPGPNPGAPPLNDIATVNIHHFIASAELENARHVCATPTPYAVGFAPDSKLYLGTSYAWTSENIGATCGFVEPSGNGLDSLAGSLAEKEAQMAALGARLIEPPKKDAEAFETVQLRASAETSTLARINLLTSDGLSVILRIAEWWMGTAKDQRDLRDVAFVALNADYVSSKLTPEEFTGLVSAWQQNAISWDVFFWNLQRGEMYPDAWTLEEEQQKIKDNPALPPITGLDPLGNPIPGNPAPPPEDKED